MAESNVSRKEKAVTHLLAMRLSKIIMAKGVHHKGNGIMFWNPEAATGDQGFGSRVAASQDYAFVPAGGES